MGVNSIYFSTKGGLNRTLIIISIFLLAFIILVYAENATSNSTNNNLTSLNTNNLSLNTTIGGPVITISNVSDNITTEIIIVELPEINVSLKNDSVDEENISSKLIPDPFLNETENNTETTPEDNISVNPEVANEKQKVKLAETVNGRSINTGYIRNYLALHNNFSDIGYKKLQAVDDEVFVLKAKESPESKAGYEINQELYAIHLMGCDQRTRSCFFRINGVPTGNVYDITAKKQGVMINAGKDNAFQINDGHEIVLKKIDFNYCDHRRFCSLEFHAYDRVEVEIE